jgi:hypothetical protein
MALGELGWSEADLNVLAEGKAKGLTFHPNGGAPAAGRKSLLVLHVVTDDPTIETAIERALPRVTTRGEALALVCREWLGDAG